MANDFIFTVEKRWGVDEGGNRYAYPEFGTNLVLREERPGFDPERFEALMARAEKVCWSEFPCAPKHVVRRVHFPT